MKVGELRTFIEGKSDDCDIQIKTITNHEIVIVDVQPEPEVVTEVIAGPEEAKAE